MPLICAPVSPGIPSGLSTKLIVASETIWLSSEIAKRCSFAWFEAPGASRFWPRWASRLVARANAFRPVSVNLNVTIGSLVCGSDSCFGSLMSEPESSESSSRT